MWARFVAVEGEVADFAEEFVEAEAVEWDSILELGVDKVVAGSSICYCPTTLQKADGLAKLECAAPQRNLLLFHTVQDPVFDDYDSDLEEEGGGSRVVL